MSWQKKKEFLLRNSKNWEVITSANLAIINFRYHPLDVNLDEKELDILNHKISEKVIELKEALFVTTILQKKVVIRMCLINPNTKLSHIKEAIAQCEFFANDILTNTTK